MKYRIYIWVSKKDKGDICENISDWVHLIKHYHWFDDSIMSDIPNLIIFNRQLKAFKKNFKCTLDEIRHIISISNKMKQGDEKILTL